VIIEGESLSRLFKYCEELTFTWEIRHHQMVTFLHLRSRPVRLLLYACSGSVNIKRTEKPDTCSLVKWSAGQTRPPGSPPTASCWQ
jgi:hypothetical protein